MTGEISQESLEGQCKFFLSPFEIPGQKETDGFGYITLAVPNKQLRKMLNILLLCMCA